LVVSAAKQHCVPTKEEIMTRFGTGIAVVAVALALAAISATDARAQECGHCISTTEFGYWQHYFDTVTPPPYLETEGPVHQAYYQWKCEEAHSPCPSDDNLDMFNTVALLRRSGFDLDAARRIAAHRSSLVVNEARGLLQMLDCQGHVVFQLPLASNEKAG
jgi:hypothetical protein